MKALYGTPWAITEEGLQLVVAVASRDEFFAEVRERALAAREGEPLRNTRTVTVRDGVAIIPVEGPLFRHASMLTEISGATSYATLRKDLQTAIDARDVTSILLAIDSPGGEVNGVAELAQAIYEARGAKPIKAHVGGLGASAAYWIASAADEIIAADTAQLGSIGVICTVTDTTEADKAAGVRHIDIVSSASPDKRLDVNKEGDRAKLQQRVDDLAEVFVSAVARNRGTSEAAVLERYGQGGVMIGARAVSAGLADRLGSFESVLAEMASSGGRTMDAKILGLRADAGAEEIEPRAKALVELERKIVSATGAANAEEAIGIARAGKDALAELAKVRAERAAEQAAANRTALRSQLEGAIVEGRLTLGQLGAVIPTLLDDASADAAIAAVEKAAPEQSALLDAVCSVEVSARALARVSGFLSAQGKATPTAAKEPPKANGPVLVDDSDEEARVLRAAEVARAHWDRQRAGK